MAVNARLSHYTAADIARIAGVSRSYVARCVREGLIGSIDVRGRKLIPAQQAEAWLTKRLQLRLEGMEDLK